MWGMKSYYIGNICDSDPLKLKQMLISNEPCSSCDILSMCGGRCLYANITKRWNDSEYAAVCNTVRSLVNTLTDELPKIKRLIAKGRIRLSDFEYVKYNGAEIIP